MLLDFIWVYLLGLISLLFYLGLFIRLGLVIVLFVLGKVLVFIFYFSKCQTSC